MSKRVPVYLSVEEMKILLKPLVGKCVKEGLNPIEARLLDLLNEEIWRNTDPSESQEEA